MMAIKRITLNELRKLAAMARGNINKIYLHWSAGHYDNTYDDYHLNITGDGRLWSSCRELTEYKEHTWHRNSGALQAVNKFINSKFSTNPGEVGKKIGSDG